MAKKDKKKKNQVVKYNKNTGMTFSKATSWLVPKKLKKVREGINKARSKISASRKASADAKAAAQKPMDDYIAKKGPIPTKPMAKSGKMDVELTERIKDNPQGGPLKHTKDTRKVSPDKATGGYKEGSAVRKAQKETLSNVKTGTSKKTGKTTHRPGRTPVTTVTPPDKWAKQIEKIRNSNMSITQKKNAINEVKKRKESANIRAKGQEKSSEHLKTEEGQAAYQKKVQTRKGISKQRKDRKKDEDEVRKYISHLNKR